MKRNNLHPELKKGEVFITNTNMNTRYNVQLLHGPPNTDNGFITCGWKTKRLGIVAYDIYGKTISGDADMRPIFAQIKEVEKAGHKVVDGEIIIAER